jgi:hypothetical protein
VKLHADYYIAGARPQQQVSEVPMGSPDEYLRQDGLWSTLTSELKKGKTILQNKATDAAAKAAYDAKVAQVSKNLSKVKVGASAAGIAYFHDQIGKLLALL